MAVASAWNVETLKNTVPADCTAALHHAARPAPRWWRRPNARDVWSPPPTVKKIEPTKYVAASARSPTRAA
jgi:hypothetical protein